MMTVKRLPNGYRVYAKGASEIILARLVPLIDLFIILGSCKICIN